MSGRGGGAAAAGGGCARPNLDSLDEAQALLTELASASVTDHEVLRQNNRLRELIRLYQDQQVAVQDDPDVLVQTRRTLIEQFIVPGFAHIEMRMLVCLFKVTEFESIPHPGDLKKDEYNRLVEIFIKRKCLVALTELLSLPRIFQLVFELFLHFYYKKSKVRILIAGTYASSKIVKSVFQGYPIASLTLTGCGVTFQIMVRLFQFVHNPQDFIAELDGSTVGNLLKLVPGNAQISNLITVVRDYAKQPLVLAAGISEILMRLIEYIQDPMIQHDLDADLNAAAAGPAGPAGPAPGGLVENAKYYVMMGGQYVYRCALGNLQQIRKNLSTIAGHAELGPAENSYMRRLCDTAVNGIIFMSDTFDQQADRAFTPQQKNKIKAIESINALLPTKLRNALAAGDEESAYTEISMLCVSIAHRVRKLCDEEPAITEKQQNLIASDFFNSGFTIDVLDAYVKALPFPKFEDVELSESLDVAMSDSPLETRIYSLRGDMQKVLQTSKPLDPKEEQLAAANKNLLGWGISAVSSTIKGGVAFCMDTVVAPAASIFQDYKHTFVAGRDPASITVSRLPIERVILSRVLHLVQKQKNDKGLTNEEKIVLNSFLRTWAHDPNAVSYHDFKMPNGTTEKRWFLNLGSLVCCFREGVVHINDSLLRSDPDPYNDVAQWFPVAVLETKKLLSCTKDTLSETAGAAGITVANVFQRAIKYFQDNLKEVIMVVKDEFNNAVNPDDEQLVKDVVADAGGAQASSAASNVADNLEVDLKIQVAAAVSDVLADDAAAAAAAAGGGVVAEEGEGHGEMSSLIPGDRFNQRANPAADIMSSADDQAVELVHQQQQAPQVSIEDTKVHEMRAAAAAGGVEMDEATALENVQRQMQIRRNLSNKNKRAGGKSRKNTKRTRRHNKGRKSSKSAKKTQQRRSSRYRRSSRKGRK
jgi:hypothetical protein